MPKKKPCKGKGKKCMAKTVFLNDSFDGTTGSNLKDHTPNNTGSDKWRWAGHGDGSATAARLGDDGVDPSYVYCSHNGVIFLYDDDTKTPVEVYGRMRYRDGADSPHYVGITFKNRGDEDYYNTFFQFGYRASDSKWVLTKYTPPWVGATSKISTVVTLPTTTMTDVPDTGYAYVDYAMEVYLDDSAETFDIRVTKHNVPSSGQSKIEYLTSVGTWSQWNQNCIVDEAYDDDCDGDLCGIYMCAVDWDYTPDPDETQECAMSHFIAYEDV